MKQASTMQGLPKKLCCVACGKDVPARLECAQCLELFRARSQVLGTGREGFTRAFFCGGDCYKASWWEHRANHAAVEAPPSIIDARTHSLEAAKGSGALWDVVDLKRIEFGAAHCPEAIPMAPPPPPTEPED